MKSDNLQLINAVLYVLENDCKWMALLKKVQREKEQKYLLTDRAYEGESVPAAALEQGLEPVVPPKKNSKILLYNCVTPIAKSWASFKRQKMNSLELD